MRINTTIWLNIKNKINIIISNKIIRFAITGSAGALINLFLIYIFIELLNFKTNFMENIANILALEISIIFSFVVNRNWTWIERKNFQKYPIFRQYLYFHIAVAISVVFRIIIFPLFQFFGINYLVNTAIGIVLGSVINYFSFDKFVFKINKHS